MGRLVGRGALLRQVADLLRRGESVALCGGTGVGKSALLDVVERDATSRYGAHVLRCSGAADERALPYAALRDLLAQFPADLLADVPPAIRPLVSAGLVASDAIEERTRSELAAAFHGLLDASSRATPVLLLLDDVQHLDPESSAVVGYARRRLRGRVTVVATVGAAGEAGGPPGADDGAGPAGEVAGDIDVSELRHLDVGPLDAVAMLDLLCTPPPVGPGLRPDAAQRVHVESGGVPALALALAGQMGERPQVLGRPVPLPASVGQVLTRRLAAQPEPVRATLLDLALMHRPTARDLERAGRVGAEDDLRHAEAAGLVSMRDGGARFTPSALADVVVRSVPAATRVEHHRRLAESAPTSALRLRHLALADARPQAELARELAASAHHQAATGSRDLAAELYLLAADRAPIDLAPERAEWLVAAVETAAPGNHVDLVQQALADALEAPLTPAQRVRARLAIPELAGHDVPVLDEVLTAALADAGDDDLLVARVLLQRARIALMESRPHAAATASERAVEVLERLGDEHELALGLTPLAVARRWIGADHRPSLDRALELAGPTPVGYLHTSPAYMAARFAFYDDRLEEAWTAFTAMLAQVSRAAGADHVHVLRCLVEVGARTGRCREAVQYADRAARLGGEFDLEAHTSWFVTAQADLVGGSLERVIPLARRGVEAAHERGDSRYRLRHLIVLGQALLRTGDARGATDALTAVRDTERAGGFGDPTVHRWHADLVSALTVLGRLDDAAAELAAARYGVERREPRGGTDGVSAQLDRAEAGLLVARGDLEAADLLLDRAAKVAADLGMTIDVGRTLLTRAHLERRRRRVAAARTALEQAHDVFTRHHALPWVAQVDAELAPERADVGSPVLDQLTDTEARIAQLVAAGASNREIAERCYVSVKTVEATLTRIYRKLDVRSRTQLAALF